MARETLAWWVEKNSVLQELLDIVERQKSGKKREVKELIEKLIDSCFQASKDKIFFLSSLRFHFDALELKKEKIMECYSKHLSSHLNELTREFNNFKDAGALPEVREDDLLLLPPGSFALVLKFCLKTPYYSKDDVDFYVIDNPLKKDWVFRVPFIAPSQWKGALHSVMVHQLAEWWISLGVQRVEKDKQNEFVAWRLSLARLFGNEKEVEVDKYAVETFLDRVGGPRLAASYREELKRLTRTGSYRGRLMFYPTFFDKVGLEVMNPHSRETSAGSQPIYLETVPIGARGCFSLLYVPFDGVKKELQITWREVTTDLCRVAEGVVALLTEFGFGAKTGSGFGFAVPDLSAGDGSKDKKDKGEGTMFLRLPNGEGLEKKSFSIFAREGTEDLVSVAKKLSDRVLGM